MIDLGKLIVAKGFKRCPKSNKSPNQVTLIVSYMLKMLAEKTTHCGRNYHCTDGLLF